VYISPTWGDAPLELIATKFGNSLYLTDVINRSKFGVDWYSSLGSGEVQNVRFAIGTTSGPHHCSAAALARDSKAGRHVTAPLPYSAISGNAIEHVVCRPHLGHLGLI